MPEDKARLLQELQTHQVELEMQNEELRRLQAELAASKARYFDLYDLAPVGYFSLSEKGLVLEANLTAAGLLGSERGDLAKQPFSRFIHPEDQDLYYRHRRRPAEPGAPRPWELRMLRAGAGAFWARLDASEGADSDGNRLSRVVMIDISARKDAEAAQEATRAQLQHSQKMEVVGRLAGGVAHDFNNLLTAILGNCGFLLNDIPEGDPKRPDVVEIRDASLRAAALTRQLLAFSRKQVMVSKLLDLNDLVDSAATVLRRVLGENIRLTLRLAPGLPPVLGDPGQLEQVVMNLAVNARDAMPKGGDLSFETAALEVLSPRPVFQGAVVPPGRYVLLTITDDGTGMDEETLRHLFEPFFTTKEPGKGTGLGLSTAFGIVRQSGGYFDVASDSGRGTAFKLFLPASAADQGGKPGPAAGGVKASRRAAVLLAEDEGIVRRLAVRILKSAGHTVLEAGSGKEALALAEQPFDLLLTDISLGDMSGVELAERLKKGRPRLPVVYMSGYSDSPDIRKVLSQPESRFLQKPFTPAALADSVLDALV